MYKYNEKYNAVKNVILFMLKYLESRTPSDWLSQGSMKRTEIDESVGSQEKV